MNEEEKKIKNSDKKFFIIFAIFTIILVLITAAGIYFSMDYIDKNEEKQEQSKDEIVTDVYEEEPKKKDEDAKYKINSYAETYSTNAIDIIYYADIDGNTIEIENDYYDYTDEISEYCIRYIQIDGLKDKEVEESLNKVLKEKAYAIKQPSINGYDSVYTGISANFNNILSVSISSEEQYEFLNIDLSTGEDIPFEKIFVSSAPINSILADGLYEALAWDYEYMVGDSSSYVEWEEIYNMDYRDTSEYEEKFLILANKYKKMKDNIEYYITPKGVTICNLIDSDIMQNKSEWYPYISISFKDYKDYIAIYKRYLTDESIFENDDLATKDIIVFTRIEEYYDTAISYGKVSNNIFLEEVVSYLSQEYENEDAKSKIIQYLKEKSEETKKELKNDISSKQAMFYQVDYHVWQDIDNNEYTVSAYISKTTCTSDYFKEDAFKDYVDLKNQTQVDISLIKFEKYQSEKYPNLEISTENINYVFDENGEFLREEYQNNDY